MAREFEFDPKTQRYRVTKGAGKGNFIGYEAVAALTEQYIEQSKIEIDDITDQMLAKQIKVSAWEKGIAEQLRDAHTNSYALGFGGIGRLTDREEQAIASRLRDEFGYLRGFSEDILDGGLSEAQIRDRASMYTDALHRTFEMGREASHFDAGFDEEKRFRNATESCQDCIDYEAMGWQPIGALPSAGEECECRSRCRCHKEYRRSGEQNSLRLLQGSGWLKKGVNSVETNFRMQRQESPLKNVGTPTTEQMELINQHVPLGDLSADEVITLAFYASNNLVWHGNGAWTIPALMNMGLLLIGRKFLLNHEWHDVKCSHGKVYDYQLLYSDSAPEEAIAPAGMREINEYIVEHNGYARLILHAYFEKDSEILQDFRYGRMDDVSTGVLTAGIDSYLCPVCSERFSRDIRFNEKDEEGRGICPHSIPTPFMLWWFGADDEDMNFAPFFYRTLNPDEGAHGIELSAVVAPDLPMAGVITPQKMTVV